MNKLSSSDRCYMIAEIGVNHSGDAQLAMEMVEAAHKSGADAVKFQTFTAQNLVSPSTQKVAYQLNTTNQNESHFEMIKKLEFSKKSHFVVKNYCDKIGIDFISTPYDLESAKFLINDLGVEIVKIASADIVDLSLHEYFASQDVITIVSVGMATLGEIETALSYYLKGNKENLRLLHCVSNYPCSHNSLNLNVINTLRSCFQVPIGFSDHSIGPTAAVVSIALGATIVEKHFTLSRNMDGPDHKASSTPAEFKELVEAVRCAELSLGSSIKTPQAEEIEMAQNSRKSLITTKAILKGTQIKREDITFKRPGTGLPIVSMQYVIGRTLTRDLPENAVISFDDFDASALLK